METVQFVFRKDNSFGQKYYNNQYVNVLPKYFFSIADGTVIHTQHNSFQKPGVISYAKHDYFRLL